MTHAPQSDLKTIVGRLVADGGTNVKAGLDLGLAVLGDRMLMVSRTANIFLMPDGKPEGKSSGDPRQVDPGEVSVYTLGFGQGTDHKVCNTSYCYSNQCYCYRPCRSLLLANQPSIPCIGCMPLL